MLYKIKCSGCFGDNVWNNYVVTKTVIYELWLLNKYTDQIHLGQTADTTASDDRPPFFAP